MDKVVVALCTLTSAMCSILLYRGYAQNHVRLLMWSSVCFALLGISNVLLYLDRFVILDVSLAMVRSGVTFIAVVLLLTGLILETR